jgi:hypothetical protein
MNIILKAPRYLVWVQLMNQIHFVGAVRPHTPSTEYRDTFCSVIGSADTTGKKGRGIPGTRGRCIGDSSLPSPLFTLSECFHHSSKGTVSLMPSPAFPLK